MHHISVGVAAPLAWGYIARSVDVGDEPAIYAEGTADGLPKRDFFIVDANGG